MSSTNTPSTNSGDPRTDRESTMPEEHLRLALKAAQMGAWEIDLRTSRVLTSESTDALFGLENPPAVKTAALYLSRVHPDDLERVQSAIQESIQLGGSHAVEYRVVLPDGGIRWLSSRGQILRGEDGQPALLIGGLTDISERKRTEDLLEQSHQQLRDVLDNLHTFVGLLNPDGTLIEVNEPARTIANLQPEDVLGKPFWETYWWSYSPEVQAQLQSAYARAANGERVRYDAVVRVGENRFIPIDFMLAPLRNALGQITHLVPSAVDISERVAQQRQLQFQADVLEQMSDAVVAVDNDFYITYLNRAAAEQYRIDRPEAVGTRLGELYQYRWLKPEDEQISNASLHETGQWRGENIHIRSDGTELHVESIVSRLQNSEGDSIGLLAVVRDVTERKRTEQELAELQRFGELIAKTLPGFIYVYDLVENSVIYTNRSMFNYLGYPPEGQALSGSAMIPELQHPDDRPVFERMRHALETLHDGEFHESEYRFRHANGSWRWFYSRETVLTRSADGSPRQYLGLAQDITARKQAEEALKEQERFTNKLVEAMPSVLYIFDLVERRTLMVHGEVVAALGYSPEEITAQGGNLLERFMHPDDKPRVEAHFQRVAQVGLGEALSIEYRMLHRSGDWCWFSSRDTVFKRDAQGQVCQILGIAQDINERRQIEDRLRESESRYSSLINAIPQLIWSAPSGETNDFVSQQWMDYTGLSEAELLEGLGWVKVLHPDDRERTFNLWLDAVAGRREYETDFRLRRWDGEYRWFRVRGLPLRDANGVVTRWLGTCTDIHDRKEAEEALRESEIRYRTLVDVMPQLVWSTRADGYCDYLSQRWMEYTGLTAEQSYGDQWLKALHPDDRDRISRAWEAAVDGRQEYDLDYRLRRFDGVYRWFRTRGVPVRDESGVIIRWLGTSTDIHDGKEAEEALRQSELRLRAVISNLPMILFATDANGIFTLFDGKAAELLGMKSELIIGRSTYELNFDTPDAVENFRRVLVEGEAIHSIRSIGEHKLENWASPLRDENGQITGMIGVSIDITERARIEEERARLLEREQAARAEAEKANRLKTQFVGMISHELRTPLTPIKGFVTTMMADDLELDRETQRRFLGLIDQETDRLANLVEQLLDVSRIQAGMLRVQMMPCPLNYIISSARPQLNAISSRHVLAVEVSDALPLVMADPERIAQVLVNLVGNAAKYTPLETTISVCARQEGQFIQVEVADQGKGISPEQRELVFEAFQQLDGGEQRKGAGLGLAICKGIIEAHGGTIWIEDNTPQGARVCFTLRVLDTST
jgi:PAS domain S-box-containing protein